MTAALIDVAVGHASLTARQIARAGATLGAMQSPPLVRDLLRAAGSHGDLDAYAERVEPRASWSSLVLPADRLELLHEIAAHVRHRARVHDEWQWARRSARGLGVSALFCGPSGTGKTLAAEVLASELGLDLYQIDLARVVSKYIGETEKHLRRIFDVADATGAILLFDEADALFGKRSEVRDSHDRYANIEVSYLLQRMESYRGLSILTTNTRGALDNALYRRLRFVVSFPFPDALQRERLWRGVFPSATPVDGLDYAKLAAVHLSGGAIRNIALLAAFRAAARDDAVTMSDLASATQLELAKTEKTLAPSETRDWS